MNKQIIVVFCLFALVACVMAQYDSYQQHYETKEKKFIQLPALKLKLGLDKLMFKLPDLHSLFQTHHEQHYQQYPQY